MIFQTIKKNPSKQTKNSHKRTKPKNKHQKILGFVMLLLHIILFISIPFRKNIEPRIRKRGGLTHLKGMTKFIFSLILCLVNVQFHIKETMQTLSELRLLSPPSAGSYFFSWLSSLLFSSCLRADILLIRKIQGKWSLTITSVLNWEVIKT